MTEKDLLKGLGHIDGAYIEETRYEEKNKKSRIHWIRWGSIAAAVCLLFTFLLPLWNPPLTVQAEDLITVLKCRKETDPVMQGEIIWAHKR